MSKKDNKELKMEMEKIISFLDGIHDFFTNHAVALSPFDPDGTEMLLEGGVLFKRLSQHFKKMGQDQHDLN